jgi:hypothetical protein
MEAAPRSRFGSLGHDDRADQITRSRAAKQNAPYRKGEGPATRQGGWEPCGFSQHTRSRAKMENNLGHFYQENESVST